MLAGALALFLLARGGGTPSSTEVGIEAGVPDTLPVPPASLEDSTGDPSLESGSENAPEASTAAPAEKTFTVTGRNFAFSMDEIRVKKGDRVTINFSATEGFHDFILDAFNVRSERVQPGQTTSVTFVADKAGTFEYYCSVGSHRALGMVGTLVVEE